jgi:hypothetical protein
VSASILGFQAPLLRGIADSLGLKPVTEIARQPGVREVYRVTVQYFDGRASNSVATLRSTQVGGAVCEVAYQRALNRRPISHPIDEPRCQEFIQALKGIRFDKMADQSGLPAYNSTDLWLVERAAGTFSHSVILAPELARGDYNALANAVRHGLPEALRMVK